MSARNRDRSRQAVRNLIEDRRREEWVDQMVESRWEQLEEPDKIIIGALINDCTEPPVFTDEQRFKIDGLKNKYAALCRDAATG